MDARASPADRRLDGTRLLGLSPTQLLSYTCTCREDLRAVREVAHEALVLVAKRQDQLTRSARLIDFHSNCARSRYQKTRCGIPSCVRRGAGNKLIANDDSAR